MCAWSPEEITCWLAEWLAGPAGLAAFLAPDKLNGFGWLGCLPPWLALHKPPSNQIHILIMLWAIIKSCTIAVLLIQLPPHLQCSILTNQATAHFNVYVLLTHTKISNEIMPFCFLFIRDGGRPYQPTSNQPSHTNQPNNCSQLQLAILVFSYGHYWRCRHI